MAELLRVERTCESRVVTVVDPEEILGGTLSLISAVPGPLWVIRVAVAEGNLP
jgi:hypothetical protein